MTATSGGVILRVTVMDSAGNVESCEQDLCELCDNGGDSDKDDDGDDDDDDDDANDDDGMPASVDGGVPVSFDGGRESSTPAR